MRVKVSGVAPVTNKNGDVIVEGGYAIIFDNCSPDDLASLAADEGFEANAIRASTGAKLVLFTSRTLDEG